MLKKLTGKTRTLAIAGAVIVAAAAITLAASLLLRVDAAGARAAALSAVGGGEVVGQELDREGFWTEYTYHIRSGGGWYEVEVNPFGAVTGLESSHWD